MFVVRRLSLLKTLSAFFILMIAGVIANGEAQQRPISEPSPKSFFFD
jgi:hypothetical protein